MRALVWKSRGRSFKSNRLHQIQSSLLIGSPIKLGQTIDEWTEKQATDFRPFDVVKSSSQEEFLRAEITESNGADSLR